MEEFKPKLYIIMREDLYDNNPGKMIAQGCHAQAECSDWMYELTSEASDYIHSDRIVGSTDYNEYLKTQIQSYSDWVEDRSFGITIVLSATLENINKVLDQAILCGFGNRHVVDPTYPYRNYYGDMYTSSEITCAWVFVSEYNNEFDNMVRELTSLHR